MPPYPPSGHVVLLDLHTYISSYSYPLVVDVGAKHSLTVIKIKVRSVLG
jgi:hypothetical protein